MKKLLGIVVLVLLFSESANTEIINLSCTTKEVLLGFKKNSYSSSIGKTNIERIDTEDKNQIITEASYYYLYTPVIGENIINGKKFSRGIYLEEIDRFTGEYTLTSTEGTNEDAEIFRAKFNKAKISLPGGCLIGARPVNYHLAALKKLGMEYKIKDGYILAKSNGRLKGQIIKFPKISVGATENSIIAACLAKGKKTKLMNCACEPEIKDLTQFLNKAGAKIKWSGRTCTIVGVNSLVPITHTVMADRIEAGTFCVAATLAKGNLEIKNFDPKIIPVSYTHLTLPTKRIV